MTEKVGLIKNPLTIIAIFAGIAEVSGTIVLPFISATNQELFIYFLICFPSILVILFFITLNFNNKVLYAPSDYKDETNYIKINKYDLSKQKTVEIKVPKDNSSSEKISLLLEKVAHLDNEFVKLEAVVVKKDDQINPDYVETLGVELLVTNFDNANSFIHQMKKNGLDFVIYRTPLEDYDSSFSKHKAIWLGKDVSLDLAKLTIKQAKEFYPHLKYIKLSDEGDPDNETIYIGGSTDSAVNMFKRLPLSDSDFEKLQTFTDKNLFHEFIEKFAK